MRLFCSVGLLLFLVAPAASAAEDLAKPLEQSWDYAPAMKRVTAKFHGRPGVVLHVGDSITYANPYGQWARAGAGQTADDKAALAWMHTGADNDTDGWWLARFDHPDGGRSYTAASGMRADELLAGGKQKLPSLEKILKTYRPQIVVLMIGTNDASASRAVSAYQADINRAVGLILDADAICILSTIPPHPQQGELARRYNEALRNLARQRGLPLIDYEQEILRRRPKDWNGTLVGKGDVHPTVGNAGATPSSAPTAENLANSGYLLRGWLSVRKIAEVKRTVIDAAPSEPKQRKPETGFDEPSLRMPVTRDTWFSNVGAEIDGNNGGATRLKVKSYQEFSVIDVDTRALIGHVVRSATLHLHLAGSERLRRVTVSSISADWVEGTASGYAPQAGSSSFRHRRHPDVAWTNDGGDVTRVILGNGGTVWGMADASEPDASGWQTVAVDPKVIAARVAGLSHGFVLFDDTGTEWTRDGEKFTRKPFPNRFVDSRESGAATAPYLTVVLGPEQRESPEPVRGLAFARGEFPPGEAWLHWITPAATPPAEIAGFRFEIGGRAAPGYLVPAAGKPGESVTLHLSDTEVEPGREVPLTVRAIDSAGNAGPSATIDWRVENKERYRPIAIQQESQREPAPLPRLGEATVAVIDELDKVQPATGEMIPPQPDTAYLSNNHLWNAKDRGIKLQAGRNEFVAFQVLIRGTTNDIRPELKFDDDGKQKIGVGWGRYQDVPSAKGPLPDPIVPLETPTITVVEPNAPRKSQSLYCEIYVPHEIAAGFHTGNLTLSAGGKKLALKVSLNVWNFTLPDQLSFLPEMNCYGLPDNERDYYRLAQVHRTVLNRVPYHQSGQVAAGCAPQWDGRQFDWAAWDRRFGPYFDGSAFDNLPRGPVPLESFYLPLNENWPTPMEGNYNGDYWADRAFPPQYREQFVAASRAMAQHTNEKKWDNTFFQCFFNGKNDFKAQGWSRGSSPWLLDEPAHFQDFWALRYFGIAFHEGVDGVAGNAKMVFRCDISRPEWQRNALDGLLDYNVVGGAMRKYRRLVFDRKRTFGQMVLEYGGTSAIEESNVQPAAWCMDAWTLGCDGVLPWQTIGEQSSWNKADPLALFYPGRGAHAEPVASVRLKAYRRGQQDVEYLTLLAQVTSEPRWAIAENVRKALTLSGQKRGTGIRGGEDAGVIDFDRLRPQDLWALRTSVGELLSKRAPPPKRRLVVLRTPRRDLTRLPVPMDARAIGD
jgi:hypothetical protein